ncbi:MAG TPA: hypothetical protein VGO58_17265 [Chitinophagaceae bacterium]|jgi:hypothetical protein|nr:hypothetical protein [Chitinophagaceae bacterium]
MSNKLELIRKKVEAIQHGLLRFSEGTMRQTMQVKALAGNESGVNFIIKDEGHKTSLLNREVNLIQKKDDDYLYISGEVDEEVKAKDKTISLKIIKAFWFTRKKKGNAIWLQEKFTYMRDDMEKAS